MALKLYFHPLSSYCMKVLMALYENDTPFEGVVVNLGEEKSREDFLKIWPIGKFPVLRDEARDWMVPESSIIIEYLDQHYPGKVKFIPVDADAARRTRMFDRFYDLNVHTHMQKIITDRLRPAGKNDSYGVEDAKKRLHTALAMVEHHIEAKTWTMGDDFSMADCAAAPALFYTNRAIEPLADKYPNAAQYLERLLARPSFARAVKEAEPFFQYVPK